MNKLLVALVSILMLISCNQDEMTKHLETGLINYDRARIVDEKLISDITIEKFAIFKISKNNYKLVLMLNKNLEQEIAEKYRMGVKVEIAKSKEFIKSNNLTKELNYVINIDFNIIKKTYNLNNYFIHDFEGDFKRFESLDFYLYNYDNEVFNGAVGNRVTIKNVGL